MGVSTPTRCTRLAQAARRADTLAIRLHPQRQCIRHPVDFIASHESLIRAAEKHPRLYQYYGDEVFPQVLREYPELYLVKCPDYRAFFAFALSCHAASNLLFDMCYPGVRHMRMETLTTQVRKPAADFRAGADRASRMLMTKRWKTSSALERSISTVAGQARRRMPHETYSAWAPWQQDMAHVMISGLVINWLRNASAMIFSMLRALHVASALQ